MEHGLLGREAGDGRQHAEGVGREHHHGAWNTRTLLGHRARDLREGVRGTRVLGDGVVIEIELTRCRVHDGVLNHRAEVFGGGEDLRLGLGREVDDLRVAAVLDVEHTIVGPAVLVVTNEPALGVGAERGLAGARQAEEHRDAAVVGHVG